MPSRRLEQRKQDPFEHLDRSDLLSWPTPYLLRDRFQLTISALKGRLARLGLLLVTGDGESYPSRQEYEGQM